MFLTTLGTYAFSAEVVDSISAIVDDEIILESEVTYGVSTLLLEEGENISSEARIQELRERVIDAFITQKVLLSQAVEESLEVEDRIVDRELEKKLNALISQVGSEERLVEYFDQPIRRIRREMRKGAREGLLIEMLKQKHLTGVHVRRQEVRNFYKSHAEKLPELPERVDISHILLIVEPSKEAREKARQEIEKVYDILMEGADFDSIAKIYSEDPSASSGGRLGFTNRGDLVPEYEEVAYSLEPLSFSKPVKSRFGIHIIRLLERQGERVSTQHILKKLTATDEDVSRVLEKSNELRIRILDGLPFQEAAEQYSDDPESAPNGGRLGVLPLEDLPSSIQQPVDRLKPGEISSPVESEFGIHLIRLEDRLPSKTISLEEDWRIVEQYALADKREQEFQRWVAELKKDHYIWP